MIIVADCGTTKCDWAVINGLEVKYISGAGFNPVHADEDYIQKCIADALSGFEHSRVEKVFFYGAGCLPGSQSDKVSGVLQRMFDKASVSVCDDLTGAAKALLKNDDGIACILGTGSNAGLYKKGEIVKKVPSMGYILGDEGSGASLGKRLLNAIYKNEFEPAYRDMFERECMMGYKDIINGVYRSSNPAVFLSRFVPFISDHINDSLFRNMVFCEFDMFFSKNILRIENYKTYNLAFVGSVAVHFKDILSDVARFYNVSITDIIQKPITKLVEFHSAKK